MSLRLFAAIEIDDATRDRIALVVERLSAAGLVGKFEAREKWHATVAFLGATKPERFADVLGALRTAAAGCQPFDLVLDTVGAFPSRAHPRVVWVGSAAPNASYAACARSARASLEALGMTFDDDAVPHVTVCRLKHATLPLPSVDLEALPPIHVGALTLFESLPDGRTTRYAVRERFPLA